MQGEFLIPIFLFGGAAAVLIIYFNNRHKERMAMIEKGVNPADFKGLSVREVFKFQPLTSLKWGLLTAFVGIGLLVASYLDRAFYWSDSIYFASMLIFGGAALILFYFVAARKMKSEQ